MSYNFVGTTDINDLMIWLYPYCHQLNIFNLEERSDAKIVEKIIKSKIEQLNLSPHGIVIYYNGATEDQITNRCKELLELLPIVVACQNDIQPVS